MPPKESRRRQGGNAMIEFALCIGLLWLLFTSAYSFSHGFMQYNKLQTAVANAGVLASKLDFDTSNPTAYETAVKNMVVYGDPGGGAHPVAPGLSAANVNLNINPSGGLPTDITITVQNYTIATFFKDFVLPDKPRVTTAYIGQIICSAC